MWILRKIAICLLYIPHKLYKWLDKFGIAKDPVEYVMFRVVPWVIIIPLYGWYSQYQFSFWWILIFIVLFLFGSALITEIATYLFLLIYGVIYCVLELCSEGYEKLTGKKGNTKE